jgi:RNA polymerase sigma-B factor
VEAHRHLVPPLALHYARRCQEGCEDLQQVGLLGLIRAAELYRRDLGTPFEAFARPHIRGAILHYLRDVAPSVRLPRRQAELQERLQRLESGLTAQNGLQGSPMDLCRRLGIDEERWGLLQRQRQLSRPVPLEEVQVEELAAEQPWEGQERLIAIRDLLRTLDPRQKLVVQRVVLEGWSYRRLAASMQVSPMTVQRLLHRALAELRDNLEQRELRRDRQERRGGSGLRGY